MNDLVKHILSNNEPEKQSITTEDGVAAAETVAKIARERGIDCALAGGVAMHLYGFTRATTDVDMLASKALGLEVDRRLSFGGESYTIKVGAKEIAVDWIVRDDEVAEIYSAALADAKEMTNKVKLVTPEWLTIMKKLADRGKDQIDLLWLLRRPGLVDRKLVEQHIRRIFGKGAYWPLRDLEGIYMEADLLKAKDERDEGTR
ncbi:MAG: hypothetical protein AAB401_18400 [Acidobacteriota bacterium]